MARLLITSGGDPEQSVDLGPEAVSIGREPGNTVVLPSEGKASRKHALISPLPGGGYEVQDLKSMNGTRVNGEAVERRRLRPGDVVEVGKTKIRYDDPDAPPEKVPTVCYLEWSAGPRKGEKVALSAPRTSIGRRDTNTIPLEDRMASGHHAEITRDLNGFTIRDLGSTNGTLVNGEPVTETLLVHGSRVRIGNARFVFKDPAMKDVEVELAGLEEDDGGWGMMADVDLAKARGGGVGGLIGAAALILAVVGIGVWFSGRPPAANADDLDVKNWISDGRFNAPEPTAWTPDDGSPVVFERTGSGRPGGGGTLVVRHDGQSPRVGVVRYAEDLLMTRESLYRASALAKREGPGRAELGMQWVAFGNPKSGATAVTQTVRLGSAGTAWGPVSAIVRRPAWADAGRLVAVVGPDTTLKLDDVRFEPSEGGGAAAVRLAGAGEADASLSGTGGLDAKRTATVLFVGASPWARLPDGRAVGGPGLFVPDAHSGSAEGAPTGADVAGKLLDAKGEGVAGRVTWSAGPDGLTAKVTVEGATQTGIALDVPLQHLEDQVKVVGSFPAKRVPPQAGQAVDGVRKALLGDPVPQDTRPPTLIALEAPGTSTGLRIETLEPDDVRLARVAASTAGTTAEIRIRTGFESERVRAQEELRKALQLVETSAGDGIQRLLEVADEFPFESAVRDTAVKTAQERQLKARKDLQSLTEAVERFGVYQSEESLVEAEKQATALSKQFPSAAGPLGNSVQAFATQMRAARWKFEAERAEPEVKRLVRLAQTLEQEQGYQSVAAVYYDEIVRRFADVAPEGATGPEVEELARQVEDARKHRDELLKIPEVRDAFPKIETKSEGK